LSGDIQKDPIPSIVGDIPIEKWRKGEKILWFPADNGSSSRSSYIYRCMKNELYYDRGFVRDYLNVSGRNFVGNNSYQAKFKVGNRRYVEIKGDIYASGKIDKDYLGLWFRRCEGDLSGISNVLKRYRYLLYVKRLKI